MPTDPLYSYLNRLNALVQALVAPANTFQNYAESTPLRALKSPSVNRSDSAFRFSVDLKMFEVFVEFSIKRQIRYLQRRKQRIPIATLQALDAYAADVRLPLNTEQVAHALSTKKFTNCYRFLDRTSQCVISFAYRWALPHAKHPEALTAVLNTTAAPCTNAPLHNCPYIRGPLNQAVALYIFKVFNSIETWERIPKEYKTALFAVTGPDILKVVSQIYQWTTAQDGLFNSAYMLAHPGTQGFSGWTELYFTRLHSMVESGDLLKIRLSPHELKRNFHIFSRYRGFGDFLSYQLSLDYSYFSPISVDYDSFIVPGPGCVKGMRYVFPGIKPRQIPIVLRAMAQLGLHSLGFPLLNGLRLRGNDIQNLFCEFSKLLNLTGKRNFVPHKYEIGTNDRLAHRTGDTPICSSVDLLPSPIIPPALL
jgi:hypothetical protein